MGNPRKTRGEYRPIYEALFHSADYRRLTPDARLVFITLKGLCGAIGAKAWPGLVESLTVLCGLPPRRCRSAIKELVAADWIEYEDHVVWVINGLLHEPQLSTGVKHQPYIATQLAALPSGRIADRFRAKYAAYLPDRLSHTTSHSLSDRVSHTPCDTTTPTPSPTPPKQLPTAGAAGGGEGALMLVADTPDAAAKPRDKPKYPHFPKATCDAMYALWTQRMGGIKYEFFRGLFGPLFSSPESARPPEAPTNTQLVEALKSYVDLAPMGSGAPFASAGKCAGVLAAIAIARRDYADNPDARLTAVQRIIHGRAA